jgi:hypothetical protein
MMVEEKRSDREELERVGKEIKEKKKCMNRVICQVCIEKRCLNKYY